MREKIAMTASFMMTAVSLLFVLLLAVRFFAGDSLGFLDLSSAAQYALAGAAVFFGAVAWLFSKFGRHTRVRRVRRPRLRPREDGLPEKGRQEERE